MVEYNLNVFKKRNPWLPIIYSVVGIPYVLLMSFLTGFLGNFSALLGFIFFLLTLIGGLFFFLYSLDRIYRINLDLLKIDPKAPGKNSWFIAVLLFLVLIGIPYFWYLLFKFSRSLERVSSGRISSLITFLLLFFIFPLGVTYSQLKVNELLSLNKSENNNIDSGSSSNVENFN